MTEKDIADTGQILFQGENPQNRPPLSVVSI